LVSLELGVERDAEVGVEPETEEWPEVELKPEQLLTA
jgi:hypothetical protein